MTGYSCRRLTPLRGKHTIWNWILDSSKYTLTTDRSATSLPTPLLRNLDQNQNQTVTQNQTTEGRMQELLKNQRLILRILEQDEDKEEEKK